VTIVPATSFRLDPQLLGERPHFFAIGLLQCAERLGCLSLGWENLHSEIGKPRSHRLIGQYLHGGRTGTITSHVRSRRRDQPSPQTHQLGLARRPGLQENVFKVSFRGRPGDVERLGGLDQRAPAEQVGQ
jgi:hypothetical protein